MEFNNLNVSKVNTDVDISGGSSVCPNGWYKLSLTGETEPKQTAKNPEIVGQQFEFTVQAGQYTGTRFNVWHAVSVTEGRNAWMVERAETFFAHLAKICGLTTLKDTSELKEISFAAYLVQEPYQAQVTKEDPNTGLKSQETVDRVKMNFGPGKLPEILKSIEQYAKELKEGKPRVTETAPDPEEQVPRKKFIKAAKAETAETTAGTEAQVDDDLPW